MVRDSEAVIKGGRIYKLYVKSCPCIFYIGSTERTLKDRLHGYYSGGNRKLRVIRHLEFFPQNEWVIEPIERSRCTTRKRLRAREEHWRKLLAPPLNKNRAYATAAETKEMDRIWHRDHPASSRRACAKFRLKNKKFKIIL